MTKWLVKLLSGRLAGCLVVFFATFSEAQNNSDLFFGRRDWTSVQDGLARLLSLN